MDIEKGFPGRSLISQPGGSLLSASQGLVMRRPGARASARDGRVPLLRYRVDGEDGESAPEILYRAWQPPPPPGPEAAVSAGGSQIQAAGPAAFEPVISVGTLADSSIVLSDSTAWAIKILDPSGRLTQVLERPFEPRPVSRRDGRRERERREDWIWVERTGRAVGDDGPTDVTTAVGDYLGTIPPDDFRIPDAFGPDGRVAFIERDEMDVPTVVVKRIRLGHR